MIENFIENINREAESCKETIEKHFNKPLIMTKENELDFRNSVRCHICENEYSDRDHFIMHKGKMIKIKNHPVRDHCHITGKYRGSAHNNCNLQLRIDPVRCHICENEYSDRDHFIMHKGKMIKIKNHPVRDHCHITGKYRGSAHNNCNLQLRIDPEKLKIPVIFHNLKGYDSHFIIKKIRKKY